MKCCPRQRNKWCTNKYDNTKQIQNQSTSEEEKLEETTAMTQSTRTVPYHRHCSHAAVGHPLWVRLSTGCQSRSQGEDHSHWAAHQ